jgi:pyruvate,water dikinase
VNGRAALDFDILRKSAAILGAGAASELEGQYFGTTSAATTARTDGAPSHRRRLVRELRVARARRRALDDSDIVIAAVEALDDDPVVLTGKSESWLLAYVRRLVDLGARVIGTELAVAAVAAAAFARLESELARTLELAEASRVARRLTTRSVIDVAPSPSASRSMFGGPTWSEIEHANGGDPFLANGEMVNDTPLDLDRALEAARARRRSVPGSAIDTSAHRLRRLVSDATHALDLREHLKRSLLRTGGEARRVLLELGAQLAVRDVLARADDVELLTLADLARVIDTGVCAPALLERRRRERSRAEAAGSLPARFRGAPSRPTPVSRGTGVQHGMSGWAASAGRHVGVGRVIRDADDADALNDGDVLVAVSTDASWLPLFLRAGAIVVERGGPLSHAAIVARELAVPAVLNVPDATSLLDGQLLAVDGDLGTIEILDTDASADAGLDEGAVRS